MKPFAQSNACRSRLHCITCRDREGGRAWRVNVGRSFSLPVDAPDFDCPYGVPWGVSTAPEPEKPPETIPREKWPMAVRVVARMAKDGERGVGDTLARLIVGGEQFKRLMKRVGVDCGCAARQSHLNALYPY
jgi:hypothetical protein